MRRAIMLATVLGLCGCGPGGAALYGDETGGACTDAAGRRHLIEFDCAGDRCRGLWDCELWSPVHDATKVSARPQVDVPWTCAAMIDVDLCVEVDEQGHVGCFWIQDGYAVAVAPHCAVEGYGWIDVGNGMSAAQE